MPEIKYPRKALTKSVTGAGRAPDPFHRRREQPWTKTGSGLGSIVAGGFLAIYGASRRSVSGNALAAAGGLLAIRGIRRAITPEVVHVERSFTINRPVAEVFSFFRNFENLPKFMHHLNEVRVTGAHTSHWVARAPLGLQWEWDAEIVEEAENRYLTWQSLPKTAIPNRGLVEFRAASEYHGGTEILVSMEYAPPAGRGGALFARVFGAEPAMQIREDLRRLKQLLETGEIPTTEGQSHGRRTAFVRMVQAINESQSRSRQPAEDLPWAVGS